MNKVLNATKSIFHILKKNVRVRAILIAILALLLVGGGVLAWYINNLSLWGMTFETGNIQFNAYVYDNNGTHLIGPIASNKDNETRYINAPLFTIENAQIGTTGTVYIAVESTGSIGIDYKLAFDITGRSDESLAYLGGYKYSITKVTDKVNFVRTGNIDVSGCPSPDAINNEIVTIDKNAVKGTISAQNGYDIYRLDYTLVQKNEEYTSNAINVYFNIFATQVGGDFESTDEKGYTYYCSTKEDLDRASVEAYPGDIIKLTSDIIYYGDLVFNKPVNLETNDFTLTVNGNLIYDYALANNLKIDVGGLGRVVVQCTKEGVGGNLTIKAPLSNVILTGANSTNGDLVVEKSIVLDATNSVGATGVNLNNIRIVDINNARKAIQLESNTRVTVSFGTTVGTLQSVVKANNIEIVNNGIIGRINLSNMGLLDQTNSPQIYILNNYDITNPIQLPDWSEKFVKNASGVCTGNTTIIQSFSGNPMTVTGSCPFDNDDIEVEHKNMLVEQLVEGNDSGLKIYYQDIEGQPTTSIQSILENYFATEATSGGTLNEVLQLEIVSVDNKAITREDIAFMNGNSMLSLKHLDMERANMYDAVTDTPNKLPENAYAGVSKYETLVLPRNLVEIGPFAFGNSKIENIITIPSEVTVFGNNWFSNGNYVYFASSIPVASAVNGMTGVQAIFVDEPYIESYRIVYSRQGTRIYPLSVLDESKQYFVRNTKYDEWEITYHIRGEVGTIGENITIDGELLNITSIYDNAYRHNYTATSVKFADSVANLGAGNFYSNASIVSVDLNNVKTVGADAFIACTALTQVDFGDSLETIGANAFRGCTSLKQKVILPYTMQKIGTYAFSQSMITEVNTGGTQSIDSRAFLGCSNLIAADLPMVQIIGEDGGNELFAQCPYLVSVRTTSLIKTNGQLMFQNCTSLREWYLGPGDDGLTFANNTFTGVTTGKIKIYVPEDRLTFYQGKRPGMINAISIFPTGEKMGEQLVNGYNIGNYIVMDNGDGTYTLVTSNLDHSGEYAVPTTYNGKPITVIYANAYRNQSFLDVTMDLGDNVVTIGAGAFAACTGLRDVKFGNSLETIDTAAFAYCSDLSADLILPASMKLINNEAFASSGITGINAGGTTKLGSRAFQACTSLVYAQMYEVTVVAETGDNMAFIACTSLVSADMPKLTKVSGTQMFSGCTSLVEVFLGSKDSNFTLGTNAFLGVDANQIKLYVPEDLVLFYQGRRIVNAHQVYPRGVKIGEKAINGFVVGDYVLLDRGESYCLVTSNLSFSGEVTVPNAYNNKPITEIYSNAFRNQSFTNVTLHLGDKMQTIGSTAFYNLTGLTSIAMDSVTTVGDEAFYGCGIKVLNAPKLTTIGNNAFRKCASLGSVSIPRVVRIDSTAAFGECASLKSIYFEDVMYVSSTTLGYSYQLQKITINKIINSNLDNLPTEMTIEATAPCKIYVPYRSVGYYTNPWSGKPVVSFDTAATYNGDTYILSDVGSGRYALIDFTPSGSMTSLTIPTTVTSSDGANISIYAIRYGAFSAVSESLQQLTLSSTIAQLDDNALSECVALQKILVNSANRYYTSINGVLFSSDKGMLVKYPTGKTGAFDMSGSSYAATVGIAAGAFENVTGLTEIIFPEALLVIDGTAFTNCTALKKVTFTGDVPPTLMGAGIFDTDVVGFEMVIPTTSSDLVMAYLCAYNFGEYEPYIDRGGHAAPGADTLRNQVPLSRLYTLSGMNTLYIPPTEEEEDKMTAPPKEDTSGDGPNPPEDLTETEGADEGENSAAEDLTDSEELEGSEDMSIVADDLMVPSDASDEEDTAVEDETSDKKEKLEGMETKDSTRFTKQRISAR